MYKVSCVDMSVLSRYFCATIVSLLVLFAMVHANLHVTKLPAVVIPGQSIRVERWSDDPPPASAAELDQLTAGSLGWPLRFMVADPNRASFWTLPIPGHNGYVFSYVNLVANALLAFLVTSVTFYQVARVCHPPGRSMSIILAIIATALTLGAVVRDDVAMWGELATHVGVASVILGATALWAALFDLGGRLLARKPQPLHVQPRGAQMALTSYLEGIRLQEE